MHHFHYTMLFFLMCLVWFFVWALLCFSQEEHDAVKAVRQIQEFNWTIAKLKSFIESSLDRQNTRLTQYQQFSGNIHMLEMMDGFIIRMSNSANTPIWKMLFQLFMAIVLCASQKMWKEGLKTCVLNRE